MSTLSALFIFISAEPPLNKNLQNHPMLGASLTAKKATFFFFFGGGGAG